MNKHNNLQQDIYCYINPIYIVLYREQNLESSVYIIYDDNQIVMKTFTHKLIF